MYLPAGVRFRLCYFVGGTNIADGRYAYTEDLLALEATSVRSKLPNPSSVLAVTGFLPLEEWSPFLDRHPDPRFAAFLRRGLTHGFRIGFDRTCTLGQPPRNF